MNLAVDIGNTRIKVGWFDGATLRKQQWLTNRHEIASLIRQSPSLQAVILSSVAGIPVVGTPVAGTPVVDGLSVVALSNHWAIPTVILDGRTPLPFSNTYRTPATLGTDRIAAVAGAGSRYPGQNALVIDAGTCITYDIIDRAGYYQGGVISPGVRMRLRAMHTFTARLPLVEWKNEEGMEDDPEADASERSSSSDPPLALTERSTEDGLRSGAGRGAAAEISQMIRMYADKFSDLHVILCGGDASYLFPYIYQDHPVMVVPELILIGLNSILQYNVNQKN